MPTNPTPITALPDAPDRSDRATFSSRATAMFDALKNLFVSQVNAAASVTYTNANEAVTAASTATTAASTASTAATTATNAASSAESLVVKYQGALAADPSLNKTGGALTAGDWYVNTSTGLLRVYNGSAWVQGVSSVSGVTSVNGQSGDVVVQGFTLAQAQAAALSF